MSLQDDLKKLVLKPQRGNGKLPEAQARDAIPPARGDADYQANLDDGGLSDLTEEPNTRIFYETEETWTDASGVFVIVFSNLKSTKFRDASGELVTITLQNE